MSEFNRPFCSSYLYCIVVIVMLYSEFIFIALFSVCFICVYFFILLCSLSVLLSLSFSLN